MDTTSVSVMATATATRSRSKSSSARTTTADRAPQPPRKRSPERSAAVLIRMPALMRNLLESAAEERGVSMNELILVELLPFFNAEMEKRFPTDE